jgi:hypothetical protein
MSPKNLAKMKALIASSGQIVLLHHLIAEGHQRQNCRGDHFDLLIDPGGDALLWTWETDQNVFENDGNSNRITATRLPDHRRVYLDFEGPLSGDRGEVKRQLFGTFVTSQCGNDQLLRLTIKAKTSHGVKVEGELTLMQDTSNAWQLEFTLCS